MRRLLLVFLLLFSRIEGGDIHAILFIDSFAENIETAMGHNYLKWKENLKKISKTLHYDLKEHVFFGHELKIKRIRTLFRSLSFQPDDLAVFYFCGHGYRNSSKQDPWPYLSLAYENISLDFSEITEILMNKSPRLLLAMVDCCNNFIDIPFEEAHPESYKPQLAKVVERNYRKLFLETTGAIVVSSSIPGEFSWAWVHRGSCFTLAFFEALRSEVKHPEGTEWAIIFELAKEKVKDLQTPQYLILE